MGVVCRLIEVFGGVRGKIRDARQARLGAGRKKATRHMSSLTYASLQRFIQAGAKALRLMLVAGRAALRIPRGKFWLAVCSRLAWAHVCVHEHDSVIPQVAGNNRSGLLTEKPFNGPGARRGPTYVARTA